MRRVRVPTASGMLLVLLALQSSHVFGFHFHISRPGDRGAHAQGPQSLVAHVHEPHEHAQGASHGHSHGSPQADRAKTLAAHAQSRGNAHSGVCSSECACTHHEIAAFSLVKCALQALPGLFVSAPWQTSAHLPRPLCQRPAPAPEARVTFRQHGFSPQAPRAPPSAS